MNKLMGFLELKESSLPTVPLKEYRTGCDLSKNYLWTVRTAVYRGDDLNLPRKVGVSADEAKEFAEEIKQRLGQNGIVFVYPYFIAEKSGTLEVSNNRIVIEAVEGDLWNLVTYHDKDVTYIYKEDNIEIDGDSVFLKEAERSEINYWANRVKGIFRDDILEGKSVLLEWSYAINTNANKERLCEPYLVFYEARTL